LICFAFEGNELSGSGVGASVTAKQYGEDLIKLNRIINELYKKSSSKPSVLAPGGFFAKDWFSQLLQVTGPGVVDAVTHHIYDLGAGGCVLSVYNFFFIDSVGFTLLQSFY